MRYQKDSEETKQLIVSLQTLGLNETISKLKFISYEVGERITFIYEGGLKLKIHSGIFNYDDSKLVYQFENENDELLWRIWYQPEEKILETVLITYPHNDYYKWEVKIGEEDEDGDIEWEVYSKDGDYCILMGNVNHKRKSYDVEIMDGIHFYVGKNNWTFENLVDFLLPELRKIFKQN